MQLILKSDNKRYEILDIKIEPDGVYFKILKDDLYTTLLSDCFRNPVNYKTQYIEDLEDTVELMTSNDFNDRLVGEYLQLCIRKKKLQKIIEDTAKGKTRFRLNCTSELLEKQLEIMQEYIKVIEQRFVLEQIDHVQGWYDLTVLREIPF
jgi:hypothetical protein